MESSSIPYIEQGQLGHSRYGIGRLNGRIADASRRGSQALYPLRGSKTKTKTHIKNQADPKEMEVSAKKNEVEVKAHS